MTYRFFTLERDSTTAVVTINRPDYNNFVDRHVAQEFADVLDDLERAADRPKVLIVTGAGEPFIGGVDPRDLADASSADTQELSRLGQQFCRKLERAPYLTIAAVNGAAVGGGLETCLSCDIALAGDRATFCQIETRFGLVPGFGGNWRLQRRIGAQRARWMIYTASFINADTAHAWGLVLDVVPHADLLTRAHSLAADIARNSPDAVIEAKTMVTVAAEAPLHAAQEAERRAFARLVATDDTRARFKELVAHTPAPAS